MKKILALILSALLLLSLVGCSVKVYKLPWDHFCYLESDGSPVELEIEAKEYIIDLLNEGEWHGDIAKCSSDYHFAAQIQSIGYNAEEGIFNDFTMNRSLKLTDEQKAKVNEYLGYNKAEPKPDPDPEKSLCDMGIHTWDKGSVINLPDESREMLYICNLCGAEQRFPLIYEENKAYSFEEISNISQFINVKNITRMKLDSANVSVGGYPLYHHVSITTDETVINNVIEFLSNATFTLGGGDDGAGATHVTLYEGDLEFEFSYSSYKYLYVGDFCFTASADFPVKGMYEEWYEYIEPLGDVQLSSYGELTTPKEFDLSEIQLSSISVDLIGYDYTKDADLIVDGEVIRILSADMIHWIGHGFFSVKGEGDFGEFIPEGEKTTMLSFANEGDAGLGVAFISANVVYTVDEIMYIASHTVWGNNVVLYNADGSLFTDRAFGENETLIVKYNTEQ